MNLLQLRGLSRAGLEDWLEAARAMRGGDPVALRQKHVGRKVALLFFEPSTRTRFSFEAAAQGLGADVLAFSAATSSTTKGESMLDTARLLVAVGAGVLVVRDTAVGAPQHLADRLGVAVINAGDGTHEHPTQGLLDALTLVDALGPLDGKVVAIVGDIRHSRVARSALAALTVLGATVRLSGPPPLLPSGLVRPGVALSATIDEAIEGVDAVMMLRVQRERASGPSFASVEAYRRGWALTEARAATLLPHCVVLHPAPMNRGVEIDDVVADGPRSRILDQQRNGVWVRMAALDRAWRAT